MTNSHVFVCHSVKNREQVDELVAALEALDVSTWIAPRDVPPGANFLKETAQALESSAAFLVVVTAASNESEFVLSETGVAYELRKTIFPIRLEPVKPSRGLTIPLHGRHWTDAFGAGKRAAIERLAHQLIGRVHRAGAPAPAPRPAAPPPPAWSPGPRPIPAPPTGPIDLEARYSSTITAWGTAAVILFGTGLILAGLSTPKWATPLLGGGALAIIYAIYLCIVLTKRGSHVTIDRRGVRDTTMTGDTFIPFGEIASVSLGRYYVTLNFTSNRKLQSPIGGPSTPGKLMLGMLDRSKEEIFASLQSHMDHYRGRQGRR